MPDVDTLRSTDFRFLLPSNRPFEHVVLLGSGPDMAERLIETNTAVTVSLSMGAQGPVDAVFVMGPNPPDLRDAASRLQPGGVLYVQLRQVPLLSGRRWRRICRALAQVGLTPIAAYAIRPNSSSPRVFIPVEAPGAFLWYLRTLQGKTDLRSWLVNKALIAIGNVSPALLSCITPDVAVVARKPPSKEPATHMTATPIVSDPELRRVLGTNDLHPLVISGQRTIMFVFGQNSIEPLAVIKIARLPSQNEATENGYRALENIEQQLDVSIASSIPKSLLLLRWRNANMAVESVMPGHSLARIFNTWRNPVTIKIDGLRDAARWLSDFHRGTQLSRVPWNTDETCRWLTTPMELYRRTFGETDEEHSLFERAHVFAVSALDIRLPIVCQHRDFRPVNILRQETGRIAVIDWEGYRAGPAFCDLFHFLVQWHHGARRLNTQEAVRGLERLLFEPIEDPVGRAIHGVVAEYLADLQLHATAVPLLILYTFLELAIRAGEQQRRESGAALRHGNENVDFLGALACHREELFGAPRAGSLLGHVYEAT
jgi:phosphotransferase family enzyme